MDKNSERLAKKETETENKRQFGNFIHSLFMYIWGGSLYNMTLIKNKKINK